MKPIHKLNNGRGATLCHKCSIIISTGLTQDLYCNTCKPEGLEITIAFSKEEETLEDLIIKEGLYRTSQNNFNQAEAGYNAKWFKRGGMFAAKLQQERILDFIYSEMLERRDYSASKMCEVIIEFIENDL